MSGSILSFIFTYVHFSTNPFFCRELIFSIGLSQGILFCCGCSTSIEISLVTNDAIFSISHIRMLFLLPPLTTGTFIAMYIWDISSKSVKNKNSSSILPQMT